MEELMKKYNLTIEEMMMMASLDNLSFAEMGDLEYIEDRIVVYLEER